MAAEFEEIVFYPDALEPEHLGPDPAQRLFRWIARGDILAMRVCVDVRHWEGLAIDLPVGRQRQNVQPDKGRRNHVVRQTLPQRGPQSLRLCLAHDIGHKPVASRCILERHNDGLSHRLQ